MCIFENDTVKSDCPMQENNEIFKDLIQTVGVYLTSFTVFMEIKKKKKKKKKNLALFEYNLGHTRFRKYGLLINNFNNYLL